MRLSDSAVVGLEADRARAALRGCGGFVFPKCKTGNTGLHRVACRNTLSTAGRVDAPKCTPGWVRFSKSRKAGAFGCAGVHLGAFGCISVLASSRSLLRG